MTSAGSKSQRTLLAALSHPMRVRILEVVNERHMSPSAFVENGLVPEHLFSNFAQALSLTSYHFRQLEKAGLIEVIEKVPRRGAVEHVYAGQVLLSPEGNPPTVSLLGLAARADGAIRSKKMDSQTDRILDWNVATLDRQGWGEVVHVLTDAFARVNEIKSAAEVRLGRTEDGVPNPISAVVGVVGFECDPVPLLEADE